MFRLIFSVLFTTCLGIIGVTETPGFQDVLDTPAIKNRMAEKGLFNGIVWTGKRLISVGQRGHIIYSDDQGKSWTQANVPVSSDLVAVNFPSAQKGWAVGHDGIVLNSADGGATWIKQFDGRAANQAMLHYYPGHPPRDLSAHNGTGSGLMEEIQRYVREGSDKPFLDVWFENETQGFIVGAFNLIFRTGDGGKNWEPWFDRTENPGRLHFYGIKGIGRDIFIAGEHGLVLKLDRAAGRFRKLKTPYQGSFFGITGNSGSVVAFGMRGNLYLSRDKGNSWRKIETGIPVGLTGATITEEGRIVLVSQAGQVLMSDKEGLSFKRAGNEKPFLAAAVAALDRTQLGIAGFGGVRMQSLK